MLGFALLGIGTSAIFPLAISAAAQRTDRPAAINVAALSQISFVAFLLGPPLLGFVSDHWGIRSAFGIGIPFIVLSLLTADRSADGRPRANLPRRRMSRSSRRRTRYWRGQQKGEWRPVCRRLLQTKNAAGAAEPPLILPSGNCRWH